MKILIIDSIHPAFQEILEKEGFTFDDRSDLSETEFEALISEYEGIVIRSKIKLGWEILSKAQNLKFICRAGSGMENIDVEFAESLGIKCLSAPEGNRDAVGEHCIGMLLTLFNNIIRADAEVRKGIWRRAENRGIEIAGKTIGIIGYGNAGGALAKKLSGFDCTILAHDKYKYDFSDEYVKEASLEEIQQSADVVSMHLPLTEETTNYCSEEFFENFRQSFYLINAARGKHLKTATLVANLKSKKLLGACIDVLEIESASFELVLDENYKEDFDFLSQAENVILSPHVAGWTHESNRKLSEVLANKVLDLFSNN
ncbi:MAG: hypothetical protein HRT71_11555 [Flavobacteriales bacterium]|nr:hypothetical protein [Flavobacteriales bacterium]